MRSPRFLSNALLVGASVLACYLLLECFIFTPLLRYLPKPAFHHMIRELRVLGQSSCARKIPEPGFIAIAGDSNAQGKGDWFIDQGYDRNTPFHSANVLRRLLQRDVLSFGRSGAGSVDGLLLEPLQTRAMLERLDMPLPRPSVFLAYFYEGNDIENNLDFIQHWLPPSTGAENLETAPRSLQSLEDALRPIAAAYTDGRPRQWKDVPLYGNFMLRLLRNTLRNLFTRKFIDVEPITPPGAVNTARIGAHAVKLPDMLQSPPMELTEQERLRGVRLTQASLALLREALPQTLVVVVYVPAPLSCYELISPSVSTYYGGDTLYPADALRRASDTLYREVAEMAQSMNMVCIDPRPALRTAALHEPIHGPRDWDHFNKAGYETLAAAIARDLPR